MVAQATVVPEIARRVAGRSFEASPSHLICTVMPAYSWGRPGPTYFRSVLRRAGCPNPWRFHGWAAMPTG
jgi:hypothetical protein